MQKWCPDAFDTATVDAVTAVVEESTFESTSHVVQTDDKSAESRFRSESRFVTTDSLLTHLTRKERAQLFDLVEQDVATEYEEKEAENLRVQKEKLQALEAGYQEGLANLAKEMDDAWARQLKEISASSARLAVQLAEKIVRKAVELDQNVVIQAIETSLYKLKDSSKLSVVVSPEDLAHLEKNPELTKDLNIEKLSSDRRIQNGGCQVKALDQEFDATVERQMESLKDIVDEAIATTEIKEFRQQPENDNDPEVE